MPNTAELSKIDPLHKFNFPHVFTNSCVSPISLPSAAFSALLSNSVMLPHITNLVHGASPSAASAAPMYRLRVVRLVLYASAAKPADELIESAIMGILPVS